MSTGENWLEIGSQVSARWAGVSELQLARSHARSGRSWGTRDLWPAMGVAEAIVQANKNAELIKLEEVGHYPPEDWSEKVSEVFLTFLRKQA